MIKITEEAKGKMVSLLKNEGLAYLRFGLQGGGCSGLLYFMTFEENKEEDDTVYPLADGDYFLLVDCFSAGYLEGSEIDYKKDIMGDNFVYRNPRSIKTQCGCGRSFGI
jgi:iron-sulfur cluster assembly protein